MSRWTHILAATVVVVATAAGAARAASPEKLFEDIFGAEAKQVSASSSKLDDAEFAEKLLKSSRTLTEAPDFHAYLCQKAYEFGIAGPKGYPSAQSALNLLDTALPNRKAEWDEKRLELYSLIYRGAQGAEKRSAGENYITQSIIVGDNKAGEGKWREAAGLYQQAASAATFIRSLQKDRAAEKLAYADEMKEVEGICERLKQEPDNAALRASVVRLYVELDDPASATTYLTPAVGEVWRTCVPLAAKEMDSLPTQVCLELGNWYKSLALMSRAKAKTVLARRTKDYYRTYLLKLAAEGATASALAEARDKINVALHEIGQDKLTDEKLFRDPAVQKAYDKAVAYLWSQQTAKGSWQVYTGTSSGYSDGYYNTRSTSAALVALFEAGANLADDRIVRGMRYLETNNTPQTEGMAIRCVAWGYAQRQRPGAYIRRLQKDVEAVVLGTANGGYGSTVTSRSYAYNYYSWAAAWGVNAGAEAGLKIPRKYWQLVLDYWTKQQKADGGWAYGSSSSTAGTSTRGQASVLWTTMGLANTALALKHLYGDEAVKRGAGPECEPLRRGLAWMDKSFTTVTSMKDAYSYTYYYDPEYVMLPDGLWQLSLLGRLTGRKQIGSVEWFPAGSSYLASSQGVDGSWGGIVGTSRAILFLINGQRMGAEGRAPDVGAASPVTPSPINVGDDPVKKLALKKVEVMKARLADDPNSQTVAQELVRLYVVELQAPAAAAPYADKTGKAETGKLLGLAAKPASSLSEPESQELGDWFAELAPGSSIPGRRYALTQAAACYKRFLDVHPAGDAARLKVQIALQKIEQSLAETKE